jgi:hypothetical protein
MCWHSTKTIRLVPHRTEVGPSHEAACRQRWATADKLLSKRPNIAHALRDLLQELTKMINKQNEANAAGKATQTGGRLSLVSCVLVDI